MQFGVHVHVSVVYGRAYVFVKQGHKYIFLGYKHGRDVVLGPIVPLTCLWFLQCLQGPSLQG